MNVHGHTNKTHRFKTAQAEQIPLSILSVILPADGKDTGNADTFSCEQTAGQAQIIRTGVVTDDD